MLQMSEISRLRHHLEKWGSDDLNDSEVSAFRAHFGDQADALLKYYSNSN